AFDIRANRPEQQASPVAFITSVEEILTRHFVKAVNDLVDPAMPTNKELWLSQNFSAIGVQARVLQALPLEPDIKKQIDSLRTSLASRVRAIDRSQPAEWRVGLAEMAAQGRPLPEALRPILKDVVFLGVRLVHPPESVRKDIVQSTERVPHG